MNETYLIAGLGNPGREYRLTRHNIGWQVLDQLAAQHKLAFTRTQGKAVYTDYRLGEKRILLVKPTTFMNASGDAVQPLCKFFQVPLDKLLVVYDDLDLPVGKIRLRPNGSAGGQNGMRSLIERLGTMAFARLRVGIDRPPGRQSGASYVLQPFDAEQLPIIQYVLPKAAEAIETFIQEGLVTAMNRFNATND
jgi:PTH1 family peptidyl-tRNA hydrolase